MFNSGYKTIFQKALANDSQLKAAVQSTGGLAGTLVGGVGGAGSGSGIGDIGGFTGGGGMSEGIAALMGGGPKARIAAGILEIIDSATGEALRPAGRGQSRRLLRLPSRDDEDDESDDESDGDVAPMRRARGTFVSVSSEAPDDGAVVTAGWEKVNGDSAGKAVSDGDVGVVPITAIAHNTRFFRIANASSERATIFLQYYTQDSSGSWSWLPGRPQDDSLEALVFELAPGEAADVTDNGWRINASKVRVWGKSAGGKEWLKYKDKKLVLVPELDVDGQPSYVANRKQVFNFTVK